MLSFAIDNLGRLEEFTSPDVLQQIFERLNPQNQPKPGEKDAKFDPLLSCWPEPEMLRQVVDRLNQWIHTQSPPAWKLDPLIAALPKQALELPQVTDLGEMSFSTFDGYQLQEAAWLRDVSHWARGDVADDLDRARNLFDWTVRNVQLEQDDQYHVPQFPWETLLFGRGTATERAWVYILLLRQLNIDAAILAVEEPAAQVEKAKDKSEPASNAKKQPAKPALHPWCVGVLIDGQVYLFDPLLGLPIPAPKGVTREAGGLVIQPATLAQVIADDKLLRRMDADEKHTYGIKAAQLAHVTALVEASPLYVARRTRLLESRLAGDRRMILSALPTAQAEHWKGVKHIADAKLWTRPYQTLLTRSHLPWQYVQARLKDTIPLYMVYEERVVTHDDEGKAVGAKTIVHAGALGHGRVLQLKGKLIGEDGATNFFQLTRLSEEMINRSSADVAEKVVKKWVKQDASYWSGLIAYERRNYDAAIDYFMKRTLEASPDGPWTDGARYNLARTYEAKGETERAILQYGNNDASPGYLGDLLRAKWLRELSK